MNRSLSLKEIPAGYNLIPKNPQYLQSPYESINKRC